MWRWRARSGWWPSKHDLVAVRLVDPREQALPAVGLLRVVDSETGAAALVDTSSARVREAFAERAATSGCPRRVRAVPGARRPRVAPDGPGLRRAALGVLPPPQQAMSRADEPRRALAAPLSGAAALLLLAATASGASAQTARLSVLADSVSAGAPFEVAVAVTHRPGRQVQFAPVPAGGAEEGPLLMLGDVEALSVRRLPPTVRGAVRVDSAVYRVVTFTADSARVGPVAVRVDSAAVRTGAAVVPVRSVLSGPPPWEPAPIGPPETFPSATPIWLTLGALALALLAGAGWGLTALFRRPERTPGVAPYPAARARLAALAGETPTTPAEVEAHVVAVRDVVRGFLADRLAVPARRATTAEVLAALAADPRVPDDAVQAVRQSLVPTDLVAFAGVRPVPEVVARLRDHATAAVEAVEAAARHAEAPEPAAGTDRQPGTEVRDDAPHS